MSRRRTLWRLPIDPTETRITLEILRSRPIALVGLGIAVTFLVVTFVVLITNGAILPYDPTALSSEILQAPSLSHLFGTDSLGRDIFSRVLAATPVDAEAPIAVLGVAVSLGMLTGTLAGYAGGVVEEVIMRLTDIFLAFPGIILALAIAAALSPSVHNSILALTPIWWPAYTRLARGETLAVKSQQFVEASRAMGHKTRYIVIHHIIPNIFPIMLVIATIDFGSVILTFSVLSFIGVGAQPPTAEWGLMSVQEEQYLISSPWAPVIPALAVVVVAIGFSLLGDGLRDALDPMTRGLFS